jgi:hypothetical protein
VWQLMIEHVEPRKGTGLSASFSFIGDGSWLMGSALAGFWRQCDED